MNIDIYFVRNALNLTIHTQLHMCALNVQKSIKKKIRKNEEFISYNFIFHNFNPFLAFYLTSETQPSTKRC